MKIFKFAVFPILFAAVATTFQSCLDDNDETFDWRRPTALVTVCPTSDGSFVMRLDDNTTLVPDNMTQSPFKEKEVRAFVSYENVKTPSKSEIANQIHHVKVNWLDSIRTKMPVYTLGEEDAIKYGNDPIEIINDWVTVAEDGYITLRVRTRWSNPTKRHSIDLVAGTNPDNPFEYVLRHNADGDTYGPMGDALIAFNLNTLHNGSFEEPITIKLNWQSFTGDKSSEFSLKLRPHDYESQF